MRIAKSMPQVFEIEVRNNDFYCIFYESIVDVKELLITNDLMPIVNYLTKDKTRIVYDDMLYPKYVEIIGFKKYTIKYKQINIQNLTLKQTAEKIIELLKILNTILLDIEETNKKVRYEIKDIIT